MAADPALTRLYAHEMATRLRAGEVSSMELLEAHLTSIAATDTAVHAWLAVDEELARAAAVGADDRIESPNAEDTTSGSGELIFAARGCFESGCVSSTIFAMTPK